MMTFITIVLHALTSLYPRNFIILILTIILSVLLFAYSRYDWPTFQGTIQALKRRYLVFGVFVVIVVVGYIVIFLTTATDGSIEPERRAPPPTGQSDETPSSKTKTGPESER